MNIDFVLSQTDTRPMYQQVIGHIQDRVNIGDWAAGTRLPSIRELAAALKVSVITIKRAYQELEFQGVITVQHGRGAFVAAPKKDSDQRLLSELDGHLKTAVRLAVKVKLSQKELKNRLMEALDDEMETVK